LLRRRRCPWLTLLSFEKRAEAVETLVPELLVTIEPIHRSSQRLALKAATHDAAGLAPLDQPGILEDAEVLHESGQRHRERIGEFADGALPAAQSCEHCAPRRIREGTEDDAERIV
jgi:hypothetical protein